jgi:hypothetical protein
MNNAEGIISKYDEANKETGALYNVFTIAGINEKEVIMCRVLTDLLNPRGKHQRGEAYLKLFWDRAAAKIKDAGLEVPPFNPAKARASAEYHIDADRRIDIALDDGPVFIALEVKIWAKEQPDQIKDYAAFAKERNGGKPYPVIYLTPYGDESETADGAPYISLSFDKDIIPWLETCLALPETEKAPPVREMLKQFKNAIKQFLGYSEDEEMDKEIVDLITKSDETIRTAAVISANLDALDDESWQLFKGPIFEAVKKECPSAYVYDGEEHDDSWFSIDIPLKGTSHELDINYDFASIGLYPIDWNKSKPLPKKYERKMVELTGVPDKDEAEEVWNTDEYTYPALKNVDDAVYTPELYLQYKNHPDEVVKLIVSMAASLEAL